MNPMEISTTTKELHNNKQVVMVTMTRSRWTYMKLKTVSNVTGKWEPLVKLELELVGGLGQEVGPKTHQLLAMKARHLTYHSMNLKTVSKVTGEWGPLVKLEL